MDEELKAFVARVDDFIGSTNEFIGNTKEFIGTTKAFMIKTDNRLDSLVEDAARIQGSVDSLRSEMDQRFAGVRLEISKLSAAITHGSAHV